MLIVKSYSVRLALDYQDDILVRHNCYNFKFSDGSQIVYVKQPDSSLLGKIGENTEQQYKAVQAYVRDNLGGITVRLSLT